MQLTQSHRKRSSYFVWILRSGRRSLGVCFLAKILYTVATVVQCTTLQVKMTSKDPRRKMYNSLGENDVII